MKYLWKTRKKATGIAVNMKPVAMMISGTLSTVFDFKAATAIGTVKRLLESSIISGVRKSFHIYLKHMIERAAMAGVERGSMIFHQIIKWFAPSTIADSMSE